MFHVEHFGQEAGDGSVEHFEIELCSTWNILGGDSWML